MPRELDSLRSTYLLDEFEQRLKSKADYRQALLHIADVVPELPEIAMSQLTPLFGDWPTWFFMKKLIAQVNKTKLHVSTNRSFV